MKLIIFFALAIVAVSGKAVISENLNDNVAIINEMKEAHKDVDKAIKANPQDAVRNIMELMVIVGTDIRTQLTRDSAKTITVINDSVKPIQDKLREVAEIAQNTADLWKLALKKYIEQNPTPVTEAKPAA